MVKKGFLAPVAAGFIADAQGWRWIWWWSAIFLGADLLAFIFICEETKYTVTPSVSTSTTTASDGDVQQHPTNDKSQEYGEIALTRTHTEVVDHSIPQNSYAQRMALWTTTPGSLKSFLRHTYQPFWILFTMPAVAYTAIQYGAALSWYSIIGVSTATYFPVAPYNFGTVGIGLLNLPPFIGCALSTLFAGPLSDWSIQWLARRNRGVYEPEMRLYLLVIPMILVPVGIFMYGFSVDEVSVHHELTFSTQHWQTLITTLGRPVDRPVYRLRHLRIRQCIDLCSESNISC